MRERPDWLFMIHGKAFRYDYPPENFQAMLLIFLWMLSLALGVFSLGFFVHEPLSQLLFEPSSALGCVGLSNGITSAEMPGAAKYILIPLMWLGRLEIIPILAFLMMPF